MTLDDLKKNGILSLMPNGFTVVDSESDDVIDGERRKKIFDTAEVVFFGADPEEFIPLIAVRTTDAADNIKLSPTCVMEALHHTLKCSTNTRLFMKIHEMVHEKLDDTDHISLDNAAEIVEMAVNDTMNDIFGISDKVFAQSIKENFVDRARYINDLVED